MEQNTTRTQSRQTNWNRLILTIKSLICNKIYPQGQIKRPIKKSMASSTNTKITLAKPDDYTLWNREFTAKAVSLYLWEYLRPEARSPWLRSPRRPEYEDYPKRMISRATRAQSTATLTEDDIDPTGKPQNLSEMTKDGKEAYQADWSRYSAEKRDYEIHRKRVADLTAWLSESVSSDYKRTIFDPTESIDKWYDKLRELGRYLGATQQLQAKAQYQAYMKEMNRLPKDLGAWATKWEATVSIALEYGVTELRNMNYLITDLEICLGKVLETWITTFRMIHQEAILTNTLTYQEIAARLRDEASRRAVTHRPATRVNRGAFGAALFNGQGPDDTEGGPEESGSTSTPTQNQPSSRDERGRGKGRGSRGGKGNRGYKGKRPRNDSNFHESGAHVCKGCLGFHKLPDCYYLFPELAPEDFYPSQITARLIQARLESDEDLRNAVDRIRKEKKAKTTPKQTD
ncbi:hypothetical protein CHU98_g6758 [Xylaria longipes]|nr:hypothetical protein CHU98_g6758 [Xylaria longipes]